MKSPIGWLRKRIAKSRKQPEFKVAWYLRLNAKIERSIRASLDAFGFLNPLVGKVWKALIPPSRPSLFHYFNPLYWLTWSAQFSSRWANSRPKRDWLLGIPGVMAIGALIALEALIAFRPKASRLEQYRYQMGEAAHKRDFRKAELVLKVLRELDSNSNLLDYNSAIVQEERGSHDEAVRIMNELASSDYAPAAIWLMRNHYDLDAADEWDQQECANFSHLAEIALRSPANRIDAHHLMGQFCNKRNDFSGALEHFKSLQINDQEYSLVVAKLYKEVGDTRSALDTAKQFEKFISERLKRSPNKVAYRIQLAQSLIFQEREEAASQLLLDGFSYSQGQIQEYRLAAGEALVEKINRLDKLSSPNSLAQQIPLMRLAMSLAPDSSKVTASSNQLIRRVWQNTSNEQQTVRQALAAGVSPESMHLMSGLIAVLNGEPERASVHLKVVRQTIKELPTIITALALAWSEMPDWSERSLELLNYAKEINPEDATVHAACGKILFRLNRCDEAEKELQVAAATLESQSIHETLAEVYHCLDREDLASIQRDKAKQLRLRAAQAESSKNRVGTTP